MITEKQVVQYLKNKDQDYIDNFLERIKNSCSINVKSESKIICPICGSSSVKKNGKDSYEKQRYFCNDCHRSFSENTKTLFFCSHFTKDQWLKFIDYEISGLTLKDEAYFMNTSITTCFYMRHKLYKAASQIIQEQKLSDEIEIDSQYLSINLKGTKLENMPKYSKKRGKQSAYRGISHHKVCVTCALDSQDNIMMNIVGLGSESFEKYMSVINRLDNVKKLISDSKSCFKQFSNELKAENSYIKTSPTQKHYLTEDGNSLASVNELMSEIENIIQRTNGFSTRYAQEYLDFNILRKQIKYKYKRDEQAKKLFEEVKDSEFIKNALVLNTPMPLSLKEAYYEYHYGIFSDAYLKKQHNS